MLRCASSPQCYRTTTPNPSRSPPTSTPAQHGDAPSLDRQRLRDDPLLLDVVRGRISLARRGPVLPPDVVELHALRYQLPLAVAREHEAASAHVLRLLLHPDDLLEVRVALDQLDDLLARERIQDLDPRDSHAFVAGVEL